MLRFGNQNKVTNKENRPVVNIAQGRKLEKTVSTWELSRSAGRLAAGVNIRLSFMDSKLKEFPTEPEQSSSSGEQAD